MWSGAWREWRGRAGAGACGVAVAGELREPGPRANFARPTNPVAHEAVRTDHVRVGVRTRVVEVQAGRAEPNAPAPESEVHQPLAERPVLAAVAHVEIEPVHGEDR